MFGNFIQTKRQIVVWANPLGGVDCTGLQRGENLTARQGHRRTTSTGQHFSAQSGNAHFQTFKIGNAVNFFIKPTAHLHTGITTR